ncbi:hypothetical protein BGZ76_011081, partial [Entomortierella beljakovae]
MAGSQDACNEQYKRLLSQTESGEGFLFFRNASSMHYFGDKDGTHCNTQAIYCSAWPTWLAYLQTALVVITWVVSIIQRSRTRISIVQKWYALVQGLTLLAWCFVLFSGAINIASTSTDTEVSCGLYRFVDIIAIIMTIAILKYSWKIVEIVGSWWYNRSHPLTYSSQENGSDFVWNSWDRHPCTNPIYRGMAVLLPKGVQWNGKYVALSYVWKDWRDAIELEEKCRSILPMGHGLWMDKICIPQTNEAVKCEAIPKMAEVYSQADAVVVLTKVATQDELDAIVRSVGPQVLTYDDKAIPYSVSVKNMWAIQNIMEKMSRCDWGNRVWTLQEGLKSTRLRLCGSGGTFCRGCGLPGVSADVVFHILQKCQRSSVDGEWSLGMSHETGTMKYITSDVTHYDKSKYDCDTCLGVTRSNINHLPEDVLRMANGRDCENESDKVYGLLGALPNSIARAIIPDYNKSYGNVLFDFYAELDTAILDKLVMSMNSKYSGLENMYLLPKFPGISGTRVRETDGARSYTVDRDNRRISTQINEERMLDVSKITPTKSSYIEHYSWDRVLMLLLISVLWTVLGVVDVIVWPLTRL